MKLRPAALSALLSLALVWTAASRAQISNVPGSTNPVEFYACNWVDGRGMEDLLKVAAQFREWAKKYDPDYSAWILTPEFHHNTANFDVAWLGAWPDLTSFGQAHANLHAYGRNLTEAFDRVIDCSERHELVTSILVDAPQGPPDNGVVLFHQCKLAPGKTVKDALQAHIEAGAIMKRLGSKQRSWIYTPGLGAGDIDFDYWRLLVFSDYPELAQMLEVYTRGGGKEKTDPIYADIASCDLPTVFDARWAKKGSWYREAAD